MARRSSALSGIASKVGGVVAGVASALMGDFRGGGAVEACLGPPGADAEHLAPDLPRRREDEDGGERDEDREGGALAAAGGEVVDGGALGHEGGVVVRAESRQRGVVERSPG